MLAYVCKLHHHRQTYEHTGDKWLLDLTFAPIADAIPTRTAWATSTSYSVGNRVLQSSMNYICRVAHTSGTFSTDLAAGKWQLSDIHGCIDFYQAMKGQLGTVTLNVSDYDKGVSSETSSNFGLVAGQVPGWKHSNPNTWEFDTLILEEVI